MEEKNGIETHGRNEPAPDEKNDHDPRVDQSSGQDVMAEELDDDKKPPEESRKPSGDDNAAEPDQIRPDDESEENGEEMMPSGDNPENHDDTGGRILDRETVDRMIADEYAGGDMDGDSELDNVQPSIKKADFQQLSASGQPGDSGNIQLLMDVELPVSIELGRSRMKIADILALGPGSIVELDKLVGEPVDLLVNHKCVARGEVVVVEENFGLRITQLISPEERIESLT